MKNDQILGASAKKYGISHWCSGKSDEEKEGVMIVRHVDETAYRHSEPVIFSLEEYLDNPERQIR